MTIYCSHLLFLAGTRIVILKLLGGNYYPWSTLIFSILITTICCITIAKVMDKYIWIKKILFG